MPPAEVPPSVGAPTILPAAANATVAGGFGNTASGTGATVGGGQTNVASGDNAVIPGGLNNNAPGLNAAIPGGQNNKASGNWSLAAGRRSKGEHNGTFVWADATDADFLSTGADQFLIRAAGGVGVGTNNPQSELDVAGTAQKTGFKLPSAPTAGHVLTSGASGVGTWQAPAVGGGSDWSLTGNGGTGAGNFVGTTDNQALELHVNNNSRAASRAGCGESQHHRGVQRQ
jgi:hypothetical protein